MADENAANSTDPNSGASTATATPPAAPPTSVNVTAPAPDPEQPQQTPATAQVASQPQQDPATAPTSGAASQPPQPHDNFAVKVYHGIMGALGGTQDVSYARGPDGKLVVSSTPSGPGTQWKRMIAGAVAGTGAALQVGPGPGQMARGAGAGVQAGMKQTQDIDASKRGQADTDFNEQQTAVLRKAQTQLLTTQNATAAWDLSRNKVTAQQANAQIENGFAKSIQDGGNGSQDLGVFPTWKDALDAHKENPQLAAQHAAGNILTVPHVNADGQFDGVRFALVTPEWKNAKITSDMTFYRLQPPTKPGEQPKTVPQTVKAGSMSNGDFALAQQAADKENLDWHKQQRDDEVAKSTVAKNTAEAKTAPSTAAKNYADANEANAKAGALKNPDGMDDKGIIDGMLDGSVDVTKTASIRGNRREQLIAEAKAKDPNFNMQDYGTKLKVRQSFASGADSNQITSFNAFLGHSMDLSNSINGLRNTDIKLLNKPINWLRQNASKNPAVNEYLVQQEAARGEFQNFINNNRALHEEDKQAGLKMLNEDMSPAAQQGVMKQFVTTASIRMSALNHKWSNAFHSDYPGMLDEDGVAALQHFGVPQSMVYHHPTGGGPSQAGQQPPTPMITVQIPGHPPGQIPASAKQKFLSDNPGATVQ